MHLCMARGSHSLIIRKGQKHAVNEFPPHPDRRFAGSPASPTALPLIPAYFRNQSLISA